MVTVVELPKLGLSEYGELVVWEVSIGDYIEEGSTVAVIESDKASATIEAPTNGHLLATYVEEGEEIAIEPGKPIGVIGEEGESVPSLEDMVGDQSGDVRGVDSGDDGSSSRTEHGSDSTGSSADIKATPRAKRVAEEHDVNLESVEGTGPEGAITERDIEAAAEDAAAADAVTDTEQQAVKATPRGKRYAREHDIDLAGIDGTGPEGAVTEDDIKTAETGSAMTESAGESGVRSMTVSETRELTGTRKTIAQRLSRSAREKPHVMGTRDISIEQLENARDRFKTVSDVGLSLNDLLLKAVGEVLEDLPEFNAVFEDGDHKLIEEVNIGYAVASDKGLVVPVIGDVTSQSLPELSETRRDLVQRVLDDQHTLTDLQGGTFTVSNVGVFDMDVSYSIINPPQVAILAIGRPNPVPVQRGTEVEFERAMTFSLTIDHRVLDGSDSGAFLERLAHYIEFPGEFVDFPSESV